MGEHTEPRLTVVAVDLPDGVAERLVTLDSLRVIELGDSEDVASVAERVSADVVLVALHSGSTDVRVACRAVRGDPRTAALPLLVWGRRHARDEELDAFAAGADDYISGSPPASTLAARLHAIARRSRAGSHEVPAVADQAIRVGLLVVEPDSYRLRIDGRSVALTAGEFRMLWMLAVHAGAVVTNDQLARANPRDHEVLSDKSIRSFVATLRRKMGPAASLLKTVRGVGYRLAEG